MADTDPDRNVELTDNPAAGRFELHVDGVLAGSASYHVQGDRLVIPHTEVDPEYGGQGHGARLAEFALQQTRARGLSVVPACPFIETYIRRHPEHADLL